MPGKRQHYIPRFLLRRFSIDPTDRKSLLYRLNTKTGRNDRVNPTNEAVVGHYYRIVEGDPTVKNLADETLDRIETMSAEVIVKLQDRSYSPTANDVLQLLLFVVTLKQRTPRGREALRESDERAGEMLLEMAVSDREHYHRTMRGSDESESDIEAQRLETLEDIRAGRIGVASTPDREVALMLLPIEKTTETLFEQIGITCVRVAPEAKSRFVLSDHPVAHYDPTPKMPGAGASFMSSPNSMTFIPLDPCFAVLLVQGHPQQWRDVDATSDDVDDLNLLAYSSAREAIYGPTQEVISRVRRLAKRNPHEMAAFAYRPPRVWVTETHASTPTAGPHQFTSRFRGDTLTRMLNISQQGADAARRHGRSRLDPSEDT